MVPYRTLSSYKATFANSKEKVITEQLYGAESIKMAGEMADVRLGELIGETKDNTLGYTIEKLPEEHRKRETAWHIIIK